MVYIVFLKSSLTRPHYLSFSEGVWIGATQTLRRSLIRVYFVCHSPQQSDQSLHYLPFSAVWLGSTPLPFSTAVWSGSTLCHSQVWRGSTIFAILSSLIKVNVYAVILRNSLIRVYTICHSQQSDQGQVYTVILRNRLIRVYTIYHSKQSDQCLLCLPFSAAWSGSTLLAILSSLIKVYRAR